jgi:branched-chain amino acid transport system permease protein
MSGLALTPGMPAPGFIDLAEFLEPSFLIGTVGSIAGVYVIFALGLQLNVGYSGIVNFGQAGFMAVGAYAMAMLTVDTDLPLVVAMVLAILISMGFGLLVGLPSLRLRADYLAIATIAAAEIIRLVARNADGLTGGNQGFACNEEQTLCFYDSWRDNIEEPIEAFTESVFGTDIDTLFPLFLVVWGVALILMAVMYFVQRTPWGRVLRAVREDEDAARALGKNTFAYKLQSLAISAGLAAIAGFFLVLNLSTVNPEIFEPLFTFIGFAVLLLGGLANYWGVAFGSIIMWLLIEGTRNLTIGFTDEQLAALRFIVVGLVLILLMAFRPQGIFGKRQEMVLGE